MGMRVAVARAPDAAADARMAREQQPHASPYGTRGAIAPSRARAFGAKLGVNCHVYPAASIWAPWNLICEDAVGIADGAVIYNPAPIRLGSHCVISQQAYLCGATHDFDDPAFPMRSLPIRVGAYAWICARATVCAGRHVGDGAVLGLGAIATRDLEPWTVYAGNPARALRVRRRVH
jgi:putative colanic acid biosynthesis acetyltransferase WcaF